MPSRAPWLLVPAAAVLIAAGNLLVRASQVNGVTLYSHYSVILCCEAVKLLMALVCQLMTIALWAVGCLCIHGCKYKKSSSLLLARMLSLAGALETERRLKPVQYM